MQKLSLSLTAQAFFILQGIYRTYKCKLPYQKRTIFAKTYANLCNFMLK